MKTLAAAALLVLTLSGCGAKGATTDTTDDEKQVESTSHGLVVSFDGDSSFEVPKDWKLIKDGDAGAMMDTAADQGVLDEIAKNMGVSADQLTAQLAALDVFVGAPAPVNGFLDNVNTTHISSGLPSAEQIEAEYAQLGMGAVEVTTEASALGDALVTTYTMPIGQITVHGASIIVEADGESDVITVSTGSGASTDALVDQIIDTLGTA